MNSRDNQVPSDEQSIEQQIQEKGLNAPRLTPQHIDEQILEEAYHVFPGTTMTVCLLTLRNGFTVTGESAAASPENFDEQIGRDIARRNARDKIWSLEGYLLREKLTNGVAFLDKVAQTCHAVNKAYCEALGDFSQPSWDDAPEWQRKSAVLGAVLHLSNDVGPEASHESWMAQKLRDGWQYGPVKNEAVREHPCIVPFSELPPAQQAKDYLFLQVVHSLKELFQ